MIGRKTPRGIVVAASAVHRHPCRNANFVRATIIGFNAPASMPRQDNASMVGDEWSESGTTDSP